MNLNLRTLSAVLAFFSLNYHLTLAAHEGNPHPYNLKQDSVSAAAFLNQAALLSARVTQSAGLAVQQASDARIKAFAQKAVLAQGKENEALSALAKSKSVVLPLSKPQGGQNADGRIDSAPDNLRDTSRNRNPGAEAGNSGLPVKGNTGMLKEKDVLQSLDQLKKKKNKAFDLAYTDQALSDYGAMVALYTSAAPITDPAVKAYASKYLPGLKEYVAELENLKKGLQ